MGQRLCGAEEAVGRGAVAPISFDGLQTQPLAGQQRLSAGGVTGGGQELEVPMAAPQQEAQPMGSGKGRSVGRGPDGATRGTQRPSRAAQCPPTPWQPYSTPMLPPPTPWQPYSIPIPMAATPQHLQFNPTPSPQQPYSIPSPMATLQHPHGNPTASPSPWQPHSIPSATLYHPQCNPIPSPAPWQQPYSILMATLYHPHGNPTASLSPWRPHGIPMATP